MLAEAPAIYRQQRLAWPEDETSVRFLNPISGDNKHLPVHRWVNWIAGFSGGFVGHLLDCQLAAGELAPGDVVLDPFMGVGTTLLEAQRRGLECIGFDINPFPFLAAKTKLELAELDVADLQRRIADYRARLQPIELAIDNEDWEHVPKPKRAAPSGFRSRIPFFAPLVEAKVLATLDFIDEIPSEASRDLFRLAFATTMVSFSNYSYEPSLATRPGSGKPLIENASVVGIVGAKLAEMLVDIEQHIRILAEAPGDRRFSLYLESFLHGANRLPENSVHFVVTSPPYLNNYHYVRNTRPHLFWLDFVSSPQDLRRYETASFGKFWQTVRDGEEINLAFDMPRLQALLDQLRALNPEKGIYGGAGWANYAASYFNDSATFFEKLHRVLRPGASAVIVVGNNLLQGIEFRVDDEMVAIAERMGFQARTDVIRETRVGSSIIGTGLREKPGGRCSLYEAAVTVTKRR